MTNKCHHYYNHDFPMIFHEFLIAAENGQVDFLKLQSLNPISSKFTNECLKQPRGLFQSPSVRQLLVWKEHRVTS